MACAKKKVPNEKNGRGAREAVKGMGRDKGSERWECAREEREGTGMSEVLSNGAHVVQETHEGGSMWCLCI